MIPVLYEKGETSFRTLGLGFLRSWIEDSIGVTEERNGEFFLEGELPVGGLNVDQLAIDRLIYAAPARGMSPQPFQIRKIQKSDGADTVRVLAHHCSYQLTEHLCKPTSFRYASAQQAMNNLFGEGHMVPQIDTTRWSFVSDIELSTPVQVAHLQPLSVRAILGGAEGSLVDLYGGELEWDHWTVRLLASRGRDSGKMIRYGVNMGDLSYETDVSSLVTAYYGWWRDSETLAYKDAYIAKSNANDYAYTRVQAVDLSSVIERSDGQLTPSDAEMQAALQEYVNKQDANHLTTSIKISAVPEELQDLMLCDTVTVVHPGYGLRQQAAVVKTVYDPIKERYKEITIGEIRKTITDTIAGLLRK